MVSDGIEAARIQAQHSPLIASRWPATSFRGNVGAVVRHATTRLNPLRSVRRPAGRHAAPGRSLFGRRVPH